MKPLGLLSVIALTVLIPAAFAGRAETNDGQVAFVGDFGVRALEHYNQTRVLGTPPNAVQAELQGGIVLKQMIDFHLIYDRSASSAAMTAYGGGIRLIALDLGSRRLSLQGGIDVDFLAYSSDAAPAPYIYPSSGKLLRYGLDLRLGIGPGSPIQLIGQLLITRYNDNLFLAPMAGVGLQF